MELIPWPVGADGSRYCDDGCMGCVLSLGNKEGMMDLSLFFLLKPWLGDLD